MLVPIHYQYVNIRSLVHEAASNQKRRTQQDDVSKKAPAEAQPVKNKAEITRKYDYSVHVRKQVTSGLCGVIMDV